MGAPALEGAGVNLAVVFPTFADLRWGAFRQVSSLARSRFNSLYFAASLTRLLPSLAVVFVLVCSFSNRVQALEEPPASSTNGRATVLIVVGAPGEELYGEQFARWAALWDKGCAQTGAKSITIGLKPEGQVTDNESFKQALLAEPKECDEELWLVFIGHGTFDSKEAKFNLRGPDLSGTDCAAWLHPFRRPIAAIDCSSASGPFLNKLSMPGRVVITATKSGFEHNYARFGQFLAEAIVDPDADLDKDGQTSLLEAYLTASRRVAEFYETEGRLATEHALLDDNGDGKGTPAEWFRGVRAVKKAADGAAPDGPRAHQFHLVKSPQEREMPPALRTKRDQLELAIAALRESKEKISEDDYYRQLEPLLIALASLYQSTKVP